MNISEYRFKITNKITGESAIIDFDDLFGYEGEECGVFIKNGVDHIPITIQNEAINYNSGYGYKGLNNVWEVESVM